MIAGAERELSGVSGMDAGAERELAGVSGMDAGAERELAGVSGRIKALAYLCLPCDTVADIGCDHGLLSALLLMNGVVKKAIAMDVNKGPLSRAAELFDRLGLTGERVELRLSDGGHELLCGQAQGAVIAGMGGMLIKRILDESIAVFKEMDYLVLGAQSDLPSLRNWLCDNHFETEAEDLVKEDGKFYQLMRVGYKPEASADCDFDASYWQYGRLENHPLYAQYMEHERKRIERALAAMSNAQDTDENRKRKEELMSLLPRYGGEGVAEGDG